MESGMGARLFIILVRSDLVCKHSTPDVILQGPVEGTHLASFLHYGVSRWNTTENPNRRGLSS